MSFFDKAVETVKAKAEEWDVQGKAEKLAEEAEKAGRTAKERAAEYADEHRDRIRAGLDKAGAAIDERTDGRYAEQITRAKGKVDEGVGKLAEQREHPAPPTTPKDATPPPAPTPTPTAYTPEPYTPDPIDRPTSIDE